MSGHFSWSDGLFLGNPRWWRDPIPRNNTSEILLHIQIRLSKTQDNDNTKCWKDVEKQELPLIVVGMHKGKASMEGSLAVPYK